MTKLPYALYRAAQLRELDRLAIDYYGISGNTLMGAAGQALFDEIRRSFPRARSLAFLCGGGNNGGDGYVTARLARQAGFTVELHHLVDPGELQGEARHACDEAIAAGVSMINYDGQALDGFDLIVDALLGTGLNAPVEGVWREAIEAINAAATPVIAADIPSGLHADNGRVMGAAVRADVTVCFVGLKRGMFTAAGPDHCGKLRLATLGLPHEVYKHLPACAERLDYEAVRPLLVRRARNSHKGDFGHLLVIGGDHGMSGAVRLAAEAAARCGAGLVSVATRAVHVAAITAVRPELMCHGVEQASELAPLLRRATVVVIGPGLGQQGWGRALLSRVLDCALPLVVDADALNLLAVQPYFHDKWVLTPHPGEAARLLGCTADEVQQERFSSAASIAASYGGVVVLKGAGSVVEALGGAPAVCDAGNPGMASGGMGDLLGGVIGALIAQGLGLEQAARAGVTLHAEAADRAAAEGERGLLASDLLSPLRSLCNP
ncbi:MAG: NAD(P)H-hydrate dehydratase [Gammaproteobacteria bacterium]|nr:NAD(P)H-hydrate dehydratase [Gammaproteobacteria bacterium]